MGSEGSGELVNSIKTLIAESSLPQPTSVTTLVEPIALGEFGMVAVVQMEFSSSLENTNYNEKDYEELLGTAAAYAFGLPSDWASVKIEGEKDDDGDSTNIYTVTITYQGMTEATANSLMMQGSGKLTSDIDDAIINAGLPEPVVTALVDPIAQGE